MYRSIKNYTKQQQSSGIKFIEIPIDDSIPWNSIPSTLPSDQWQQIDNQEEIEKVLTSRDKAYLSQPEGTPFIIAPFKEMLRLDSFIPFGNDLFTSTADMTTLPLSKLQKLSTSITCKRHRVHLLPLFHLTYQ